jgi:MoaA/NifB/PqqE/SkfB family radical SAM enzyme
MKNFTHKLFRDISRMSRGMNQKGNDSTMKKLNVLMTGEQQRRWVISPQTKYLARETPEGLLLRPANHLPTKIYLEPTTKCNLQCRSCMRNTWDEPGGEMAMETFGRLLSNTKKIPSIEKIAFWGFGEPLMHPNIIEMIKRAAKQGLKTELITNGLLLSRDMAEAMISAGLDALVVSVDGITPEQHADIRPGADLNTVKRNIEVLNGMKLLKGRELPEIGLEFVLMRRNLSELPHLPSFARSMRASFIIVSNILPYTKELKDEILYGISAGRPYGGIRSRGGTEFTMPVVDVKRDTRGPLMEFLLNAEACNIREPRYPNVEAFCPFVWEGSLCVSWDGSVSPCPALMHSYTCFINGRDKSIRRYQIGNINKSSLLELWGNEEFKQCRKRILDFDFPPCIHCQCDLSETNEEDCYGNPFPTCGDCLWAYGIVLCP